MDLAVTKLFNQDRPVEQNDLLFDFDRFTDDCLYDHTIDAFVKEMKKRK